MSKLDDVEKKLKKMLGEQYGGPCLAYQDGEFVLYTWSDAPVCLSTVRVGKTLKELVRHPR